MAVFKGETGFRPPIQLSERNSPLAAVPAVLAGQKDLQVKYGPNGAEVVNPSGEYVQVAERLGIIPPQE
jgi:hypothetical protein